jgi:hypothetical protein
MKPKQSPRSRTSQEFMLDQRRGERRAAEGSVSFVVAELDGISVSGQLLDLSESGFRASHNCPALQSGQIVCFEHPCGSGTARVVWNRMVGNMVESGFVVVGQIH